MPSPPEAPPPAAEIATLAPAGQRGWAAAVVVGMYTEQGEGARPPLLAAELVGRWRFAEHATLELVGGWDGVGPEGRLQAGRLFGDVYAGMVPWVVGGMGVRLGADMPSGYVNGGFGFDVPLARSVDLRAGGDVRVYGEPSVAVVVSLGVQPRSQLRFDEDADGIPDTADRCRDAPEDADGRFDTDGCPDPDDDFDGVADADDACRDAPEDRDHFLDKDGCPDPDNDGDGVVDQRDICPSEPEDADGHDDSDGCLDPDDDRDHLYDTVDACPKVAEDEDGFEDLDGCPDPDNDGDGVADRFDGAPLEPETINGWQDQDGVPDGLPPVLARYVGALPAVRFREGEPAPTAEGHGTLALMADVYRSFPGIVVGVEVRGGDRSLAQARAEQVRDHLVAAGLAAEAVRALPAGEAPGGEHGGAEPVLWVRLEP